MDRVIVGDLGWCVGKITVANGVIESLIIVSPADTGEGRYAPAETVCVYGRSNLVKLQTFLGDAMKADEAQP